MDHVRVGGVCLLLIIIAAALPINVLAQTPQAATSDNAANGAAPIISQSLLSKSAQGETISAENLAKRNTGLKPLATSKSKAASVESQTSGQPESPNIDCCADECSQGRACPGSFNRAGGIYATESSQRRLRERLPPMSQ